MTNIETSVFNYNPLMGRFLVLFGKDVVASQRDLQSDTYHLFDDACRVATVEIDMETLSDDVIELDGRIITSAGEVEFKITSEMTSRELIDAKPSMELDAPYYP